MPHRSQHAGRQRHNAGRACAAALAQQPAFQRVKIKRPFRRAAAGAAFQVGAVSRKQGGAQLERRLNQAGGLVPRLQNM